MLTTSRAPLGLSSESVYPLPELSPPTTRRAVPAAREGRPARRRPARRCRARAVRAGWTACRWRWNWPRRGCGSCRWPRSRDAWTTGSPCCAAAPGTRRHRHRTLHAVIDWSWHLLEPDGRAAMRALSVFPDGFTADAARHLLGDDAAAGTAGRPVAAQGVRHRVGHAVPHAGDRARVQRGQARRGRRDRPRARRGSSPGQRISACGTRSRRSAPTWSRSPGRPGPSRTTWCRRCATGWTGRTARPSPRRRASCVDCGWSSRTSPAWARWPPTRPGCCPTTDPSPGTSRITRTALVLSAVSGFLLPGPPPLRLLAALRRVPDGAAGHHRRRDCTPSCRAADRRRHCATAPSRWSPAWPTACQLRPRSRQRPGRRAAGGEADARRCSTSGMPGG